MEKRAELPEARKPLKECIDEVQLKPRLKALAESLKPLELTPEALVLARHGYSSALTEDAVRQLEGLAKMSKTIDRSEVYELNVSGVGEILGRTTFVGQFVLPSKDKILGVRRNGDFEIPGVKGSKSLLDEYFRVDREKDYSSIISVLLNVINRHDERSVKILEAFEDRFRRIFVRRDITLDKILDTPWEIVANTGRASPTKYYDERVKAAGLAVFGVHIHLNNLRPSPFDIYVDAGPTQRLEWTGIMLVKRGSWWETRLSKENFAAFHSDINDAAWLRRIMLQLSDANFAEPYFMQQDFTRENRARMMKYGELLEKIG